MRRITIAKHCIQLLKETFPIHLHLHISGRHQRQLKKDEVHKMLKVNVSQATTTEKTLSNVSTPKKDGSLQICVDHCKLNAVAVRDSYLVPQMEECINSLGSANVFSVSDSNSSY